MNPTSDALMPSRSPSSGKITEAEILKKTVRKNDAVSMMNRGKDGSAKSDL